MHLHRRLGAALTAAVAATAVLTGTAQAATTMTDLGMLPTAIDAIARGVNNYGVIVGRSSGHTWSRPTKWVPGSGPVELPELPGGRYGIATGINSHGVISGHSEVADTRAADAR